jgi:endonuclease-3
MAIQRSNHKPALAQRTLAILEILKKTYPNAKCSLNHSNPLELLVATILSAQCTDDRVNIATKELFRKYKSAKDYAQVSQEELEKDIQSTGFYRNKAKSIRAMAQSLLDLHSGKVPDTMEQLVDLAGVGRKTANVILGNAFHKNVGMVVDTHVGRLAVRMGFTKHTDPVKVEQDLMQLFPQESWCDLSHLLIYHGRALCTARKAMCDQCPLAAHCPKIGVTAKKG